MLRRSPRQGEVVENCRISNTQQGMSNIQFYTLPSNLYITVLTHLRGLVLGDSCPTVETVGYKYFTPLGLLNLSKITIR